MKKELVIVLLIVLAISLTGCSEQLSDDEISEELHSVDNQELELLINQSDNQNALVGQALAGLSVKIRTIYRKNPTRIKSIARTELKSRRSISEEENHSISSCCCSGYFIGSHSNYGSQTTGGRTQSSGFYLGKPNRYLDRSVSYLGTY